MEYPLKRGQALVLSGPQGCGKSTLARQIAARHGTYAEIDGWEMFSPFHLGGALATRPATVIVRDILAHELARPDVTAMITGDFIRYEQMFQPTRVFTTPHFIFCTGSIGPGDETTKDPRFRIVRLEKTTDGRGPRPYCCDD